MLTKIKQYLLRINKAAGVELVQLDEDKFEIRITIARVEKNKIKHESLPVSTQLSSLTSILDVKIPLFITINGKGVLTKAIAKTNHDNALPDQILPNTNLKDYYYEIIQGNSENFVSLARKVHIDSVLKQLNTSGYTVLGFSLGTGSLDKILKFIEFDGKKSLSTKSHILNFNSENYLESIEANPQQPGMTLSEYLVGDQYVNSNEIVSFGGAVNLLSEDLDANMASQSNHVSDMRQNYRNSKLFRTAAWASLSLVLFVLLLNFFVYNNYFKKNQQLETSTAFVKSESVKSDSMKASAQHIQSFIESSGWNKQSMYSLISDRIAGMVPQSITLEMMNIHPADSESSNFKQDTIIIAGTADDAMEVNRFMNNIKSIKQVKEAAVKNYQYKREKEMGTFVMEIIAR